MELKATSNDRVIFTSLKPMSEVNLSIPVLFYDKRGDAITGIFLDAENIICDGVAIQSSEFIGWHYIPNLIQSGLSSDQTNHTWRAIQQGQQPQSNHIRQSTGKY